LVDLNPSLTFSHERLDECDGSRDPPLDLIVSSEYLPHVPLHRRWLVGRRLTGGRGLSLIDGLAHFHLININLSSQYSLHSFPLGEPVFCCVKDTCLKQRIALLLFLILARGSLLLLLMDFYVEDDDEEAGEAVVAVLEDGLAEFLRCLLLELF